MIHFIARHATLICLGINLPGDPLFLRCEVKDSAQA